MDMKAEIKKALLDYFSVGMSPAPTTINITDWSPIADDLAEYLAPLMGATRILSGEIHISPSTNPKATAQKIADTISQLGGAPKPKPGPSGGVVLPTGPTAPSAVTPLGNGRDGKVTERDRFLDDASDRRCALSAAARYMAVGSYVKTDVLIGVAEDLYQHLREGKPTA